MEKADDELLFRARVLDAEIVVLCDCSIGINFFLLVGFIDFQEHFSIFKPHLQTEVWMISLYTKMEGS